MDYSIQFKNFLDEVFSCKQYKKLAPGFKVFGFVAVLPFIIWSASIAIWHSVLIFFYKLSTASVEYLEQWVKKTKEGVCNLTEAVLYLVTMPYIFFNYIFLSFLSMMFFISWFSMQCTFYIATLGGIRWRPYITQLDGDDSIDSYMVTTNQTAAGVDIIILTCLYILNWILAFVFILAGFNPDILLVIFAIGSIYSLTAVISIPIIFRKTKIGNTHSPSTNDDENDTYDDYFELPEV